MLLKFFEHIQQLSKRICVTQTLAKVVRLHCAFIVRFTD